MVYVPVGGGLSTYANGRGLQQNLAAELLRVEEDEDPGRVPYETGLVRPGEAAVRTAGAVTARVGSQFAGSVRSQRRGACGGELSARCLPDLT